MLQGLLRRVNFLYSHRCWTYETSILLNTPISNELPYNDFFEYYAPDFKLHLTPTNAENQNTPETLQEILNRVLQNLKAIQGAPSVQMQPIPPDWIINRVGPQVLGYQIPFYLYRKSKIMHLMQVQKMMKV